MSDESTKKILLGPVADNNPIILQVLGICSALAVTSKLETALIMCVGLTLVTAFSNLFYSLVRNYIPGSIRIIAQMAIAATLVIAFVCDAMRNIASGAIGRRVSTSCIPYVRRCAVCPSRAAYMIPPAFDIILDNPVETMDDNRATLDLLYEMPRPYTLTDLAGNTTPVSATVTRAGESSSPQGEWAPKALAYQSLKSMSPALAASFPSPS